MIERSHSSLLEVGSQIVSTTAKPVPEQELELVEELARAMRDKGAAVAQSLYRVKRGTR